jgi:hypothetical protein
LIAGKLVLSMATDPMDYNDGYRTVEVSPHGEIEIKRQPIVRSALVQTSSPSDSDTSGDGGEETDFDPIELVSGFGMAKGQVIKEPRPAASQHPHKADHAVGTTATFGSGPAAVVSGATAPRTLVNLQDTPFEFVGDSTPPVLPAITNLLPEGHKEVKSTVKKKPPHHGNHHGDLYTGTALRMLTDVSVMQHNAMQREVSSMHDVLKSEFEKTVSNFSTAIKQDMSDLASEVRTRSNDTNAVSNAIQKQINDLATKVQGQSTDANGIKEDISDIIQHQQEQETALPYMMNDLASGWSNEMKGIKMMLTKINTSLEDAENRGRLAESRREKETKEKRDKEKEETEQTTNHNSRLFVSQQLLANLSIMNDKESVKSFSLKDAEFAASSAAMAAAHVASSLPAGLPSSVREDSITTATAAAVKASLENDGEAVATSAATTAARVAESLAPDLPSIVKKATLDAAAVAAVQAAVEQPGLPATSSARTSNQVPPPTPSMISAALTDVQIPVRAGDSIGMPHIFAKPSLDNQETFDVPDSRYSTHDQMLLGRPSKVMELPDGPRDDRLLYVGIFSNPSDFDLRSSARAGWISALRNKYVDPETVLVEFVIGRKAMNAADSSEQTLVEMGQSASSEASKSLLDVRLAQEQKGNGDILRIANEEVSVKVLMFFAHAVKKGYEFVMKMDVDQELLYRPVLTMLEADNSRMLYAGQDLKDAPALEDRSGRREENKQDYSYFSGPCYMTSWALAQRMSKVHLDHSIMLWSYSSTAGSDSDSIDVGHWVAYEDSLLRQMGEERHKHAKESTGVRYVTMDLCQDALP